MPFNAIFQLHLLVALVTVPTITRAIDFCDPNENLVKNVQKFYDLSDVVLAVAPNPTILKYPEEYKLHSANDWLIEYKVLKVWKGEVGQTIYINRNVDEFDMGNVVFGMREADSGPFTLIGFCVEIDHRNEIFETLDKIYGAGYLPSKELIESTYTNQQKMAMFASIGIGLVCIGGLLWLILYMTSGHNKAPQVDAAKPRNWS